jgi:hypothetical protein
LPLSLREPARIWDPVMPAVAGRIDVFTCALQEFTL